MTDEERRNEVNHKCSIVKMVTSYLFILLQTKSLHLAIPHPALRATFPSGEGIVDFHMPKAPLVGELDEIFDFGLRGSRNLR